LESRRIFFGGKTLSGDGITPSARSWESFHPEVFHDRDVLQHVKLVDDRLVYQAGSRSAVAAGSRSGADPWHRGIPLVTGNPRGCLLIQGALACGTDAESVKMAMIDWRKSSEDAMKKRLQQAQSKGELPREIQPADFARYLSSVMAGLGVQAANRATRAELRRVAAIALRCIEIGLSGSASG